MEPTQHVQQLLFSTIDSLPPATLADTAAVRQLLVRTALQHGPFAYESVGKHIEMLVAEYCPASRCVQHE
jgi:hypothetical protein